VTCTWRPVDGRGGVGPPQRLTLEGRNNIPSTWTPDGQTLFFYSDRNGIWNIFRQSLHERNAQISLWTRRADRARLSPDAAWVCSGIMSRRKASRRPLCACLRVPISGGAPEPVIETSSRAAVRCALGHSACVLSEFEKSSNKLIFSTVDLAQNRKNEVVRLEADPSGSPAWDLSHDGSP